MRIHLFLAAALLISCFSVAAAAELTSDDLSTADGSCRVGRHGDKMYCVLTATTADVQLVPDKWTSDDEHKKWDRWLVDFDDDLYSKWLDSNATVGQETVRVVLDASHIAVTNGHFLGNADVDQQKFEAAMQSCLQRAYKSAAAMPSTINPLKEVRFTMTFMCDAKVVPRYGKRAFGFAAIAPPPDNTVVVYGRLLNGRSPGIQIIGDGDGGSIQVTDPDVFQKHCSEIDAMDSRAPSLPLIVN